MVGTVPDVKRGTESETEIQKGKWEPRLKMKTKSQNRHKMGKYSYL